MFNGSTHCSPSLYSILESICPCNSMVRVVIRRLKVVCTWMVDLRSTIQVQTVQVNKLLDNLIRNKKG